MWGGRGALTLAFGLLTLAYLAGCGSGGGPPSVVVLGSLTTVRFDQPIPDGTGTARIEAARNEFESFQVAVDAGSGLENLSVESDGPLTGPGGSDIPENAVQVYREVPYAVSGADPPPSGDDGGAGLWPDALIPTVDPIYGEHRDAFPVDLGAGGKAVAWIDVQVPARQRAGIYNGTVLVRADGLRRAVPVRVRVWPFGIPSTPTLASAFQFDYKAACEGLTGSRSCHQNEGSAWRVTSLFARLALRDRITIANPFALEYGEAPATRAEKKLFDRYTLPLIDGTAGAGLDGARLTSVDQYWNCIDSKGSSNECLKTWRALARKDGFADRFFLYACDEPLSDPALWAVCRKRFRAAQEQSPGVSSLLTANVSDALSAGATPGDPQAGLRDLGILTPLVNDLDGKEGSDLAGDQREAYDAFLNGGDGPPRKLWFYTSCQSYGCDGQDGDPSLFSGWPGYAIDEAPSEARATGWLAYLYRVSGELYYQTTAMLPTAWTDSYRSGGNGDGTLFYPGLPKGSDDAPAIGGTHAVPLDSIRMKRIRDGREDYEYLHILDGRGEGAAARSVVESVFGPKDRAMFSTDVPEDRLLRARAALAALIVGSRR